MQQVRNDVAASIIFAFDEFTTQLLEKQLKKYLFIAHYLRKVSSF